MPAVAASPSPASLAFPGVAATGSSATPLSALERMGVIGPPLAKVWLTMSGNTMDASQLIYSDATNRERRIQWRVGVRGGAERRGGERLRRHVRRRAQGGSLCRNEPPCSRTTHPLAPPRPLVYVSLKWPCIFAFVTWTNLLSMSPLRGWHPRGSCPRTAPRREAHRCRCRRKTGPGAETSQAQQQQRWKQR